MKKNILLIFALVILLPVFAAAQGNAFNFQGRLNDGTNPANGSYDLQFRLYDAIAGGAQIGATLTRANTTLVNGVFSVNLDFGAAAFNSPNAVFIEISVKPNGSPNAYTILGPHGKTDIAVFRNGDWYYLKSSNGGFVGQAFGLGTDIPIPAAFSP